MIHYFFFHDTAPTEIYTLSLHDALPICGLLAVLRPVDRPARDVPDRVRAQGDGRDGRPDRRARGRLRPHRPLRRRGVRSEEHTSELQSRLHLVCRLLLEKKKNIQATLCT